MSKHNFKVGDKVNVTSVPSMGPVIIGRILEGGNLWPKGGVYADGDPAVSGLHPSDVTLVEAAPKRDYVADHARRTLRKAGLTKVEAAQYVENYKKQNDGKEEDFPSLSEFSRKIPERFAYARSGFVLGGFAWADTPEGVDYWSAIDDRLTKEEHAQAQP